MPILSAQNILLRFGGPPLLDNVSFDIEAGDRICLVGRNGEGKSTLLKILTGEMEANSGDIVKKAGLKVARMIQEIPAHIEGTVRDVVMSGIAQDGPHKADAEAMIAAGASRIGASSSKKIIEG
jgi:ATP-binding cassette subfamily F protein uup